MPLAHPLLNTVPRHDSTRLPNLAAVRDPQANSQLEKALHNQGYDYGTSILNFPPRQRSFDLLPVGSLYPVWLPFLKQGDLLFHTTRPPLSDGLHEDKKKVEPSNTTLERAIFLHWWRYFEHVTRSWLVLRDATASFLPPGYKNRQQMTFHQTGCRYQYLQEPGRRRSRRNPLGERTAAFLLRVDEIYPGGPGLVAAWGLNAIATLAWCRMLHYDCSYLLDNRGLTMVELEPSKTPARPSTYGFMDDWGFDVVFETGVEFPARPEEETFAIAL